MNTHKPVADRFGTVISCSEPESEARTRVDRGESAIAAARDDRDRALKSAQDALTFLSRGDEDQSRGPSRRLRVEHRRTEVVSRSRPRLPAAQLCSACRTLWAGEHWWLRTQRLNFLRPLRPASPASPATSSSTDDGSGSCAGVPKVTAGTVGPPADGLSGPG